MKYIAYNDVDEIKKELVGHRIIHTASKDLDTYHGVVEFTLDNGRVFVVEEAEGGCACSNGCFNVANPETTDQIITNVEFEEKDKYDNSYGSAANRDGEAIIKLFVYADQIKTELIRSEGGDNGYYGWGYNIHVREVSPELKAVLA